MVRSGLAQLAGLTRLHDGIFRNYTTADGLSNRTIANVFQDSSGVIWVATDTGIDRLDGDKFVSAFRPQDHRDLYIAGESPLGDLYVELGGAGISRLKDGKLMGIAPLYGTEIQVVQQDLWIAGGTGGVTRVRRRQFAKLGGRTAGPYRLYEFRARRRLFVGRMRRRISEHDHHQGRQALGRDYGRRGHAGSLQAPSRSRKPFEYISEVDVDRKKRNAGRELILPPGLHHTELQLGSIELSSPERTHMQYRLEGIDSAWLDAKPDGAAVYTTIPHGTYLFHVRASNGDGVWDRQGIVYRITQEPFFYETAAFRILMIAAGCIAADRCLSIPASAGIGADKDASRRTRGGT